MGCRQHFVKGCGHVSWRRSAFTQEEGRSSGSGAQHPLLSGTCQCTHLADDVGAQLAQVRLSQFVGDDLVNGPCPDHGCDVFDC